MSVLVCGSVAYDNIMVFQDYFKNHILTDKVDSLNVAFYSPEMRKEFGGCAGNIAYNSHLLGINAQIVAAVGQDFSLYETHLNSLGLSTSSIAKHHDIFCAQAFITTDLANNQITTFHSGAMERAGQNTIPAGDWKLAIVSPDSRAAILAHSSTLADLQIPFIFDPGQALPILSKADVETVLDKASYLIVNNYELALLQEKTGKSIEDWLIDLKAVVVTKSGEGSTIYTNSETINIDPISVNAVDPTGCGDAYRAGIIYGILNNLGWAHAGKIASLCGAYKVEVAGTQNHHYSISEFKKRFSTLYA